MRKIRGRVVGTLLAGALFALALAGASLADHNQGYSGSADSHFVVDGKPSCPAGTTAGGSIQLTPGANGTYGEVVTVTGYDGKKFNWSFTDKGLDLKDMAVVIVQGDEDSVVYGYDYLLNKTDDADSGLTAPFHKGDDEDELDRITRIEFCMDVKHGAETGKLIVRKVVEGSEASPESFSFTIGDTTTPFEADGDNEVELAAGSYTVTEPDYPGFETAYDNCTDVKVGPDVDGTPVCTITNTAVEQPTGTLIVRKVVVGSNDSPTGFSFQIGGVARAFEADGENEVELPAGFYDVFEPQANQNGYATTYDGCDDVEVVADQGGEGSPEPPVCTITNSKGSTPPPYVPPPTPKLDVWVQKGATQQATLENGTAAITYDVVLSNNGPNQANNVTLTDNAPAGVTFVAINGTSGPPGTCSLTPTTLSCTYPVIGPGVVAAVSLSATVASTGTFSNTACAYAEGNADTNGGNNCSTANTVVVAPITPPTVTPPVAKPPVAKPPVVKKPKPRKPQNVCAVLTISTRTLSAGKYTGVVVKVTRKGRAVAGAKVRFKGPGIFKSVTTKRTGIVVTKLRPSKPGIIRVSVINKRACSAKRIGVLGTFQPPVTG